MTLAQPAVIEQMILEICWQPISRGLYRGGRRQRCDAELAQESQQRIERARQTTMSMPALTPVSQNRVCPCDGQLCDRNPTVLRPVTQVRHQPHLIHLA